MLLCLGVGRVTTAAANTNTSSKHIPRLCRACAMLCCAVLHHTQVPAGQRDRLHQRQPESAAQAAVLDGAAAAALPGAAGVLPRWVAGLSVWPVLRPALTQPCDSCRTCGAQSHGSPTPAPACRVKKTMPARNGNKVHGLMRSSSANRVGCGSAPSGIWYLQQAIHRYQWMNAARTCLTPTALRLAVSAAGVRQRTRRRRLQFAIRL